MARGVGRRGRPDRRPTAPARNPAPARKAPPGKKTATPADGNADIVLAKLSVEPEARAQELREVLDHHSRQYYVLDNPEISTSTSTGSSGGCRSWRPSTLS